MAGSGTWTPIGPSVHVSVVADAAMNDLYALGNDGSLLLQSGDFGASWSAVSPPPVADCHFLFSVVAGAGIFAGGGFPSGGPYDAPNCSGSHYKSTDRGMTWTLLPEWPFGVFPTTRDPVNPSILYGIYPPTSVYKSVDGGATWSLLPTGTPYPFGLSAIAIDTNTPSTLYTFGGKTNFLKSTDGGASWITANAGLPGAPGQPNSGIVGLVQVGSTLILGTDGSGIYRSTDGAATWAPANAGLPNLQLVGLVKGNEPVPTIYALANNGNSTTFFRSTDSATTWVQTGTLNAPFAAGLVFTAQSPPVAYATSAIGLFKSTDGTATWLRVPPTANLPNAPVPILLGDSGDPLRVYASISSSQSYALTSADSGKTWSLLTFPDGTPVTPLSFRASHPNMVYGRNPFNGALVRSFDAGTHWNGILPPLTPGLTFTGLTSVLEGKSDSFVLFAVGNTTFLRIPGSIPIVLRSDNDSGEWVDASHGLPQSSRSETALEAIAIDPTNNDVLYAATDGGLFKTTDGGGSWNPIGTGFPANPASTLVVDPSRPNIVYAAFGVSLVTGQGAGVFASADGGLTWNPRNTGLTDFTITALAIDRNDPQSLYAGTATQGVFRTIDGGMHWAPFTNGLPAGDGLKILSLEVDPVDGRNIFVGTADGAFAFTLDASTPFIPVIEYYAQSLDHYFMATEAQPDIAALDSGAIPGWVRTGQTFRAFPGPTLGASPLCRFYIPPAYGDSHFFSASPAECARVQARFPFFDLETPNAFYVYPPDAAGTCAQGTIPLYRVWDARPDTNHRYTTDPSIREQMIARGWLAEGSGIGVVACVPSN
jgi:photosystem II stability/assembly factor-like uncharacterized protein